MESAPSALESAGADVNVEEEISYSSLQLKNPNAEDRRRIRQYLMQKRLREGKKERPECEACMRLGHPDYKCPYLRAVEEGTPVGPGWAIVCSSCLGEDCLPGNKKVLRCAVKKYCAKCSVSMEHSTLDCPKLTPKERHNFERNAKRMRSRCEYLASKRRARQSLANLSLESQ